jgi:hypothetical protein
MRKTERIPVNDPVIERIETLLRENNLSQQQLLKGVSKKTG